MLFSTVFINLEQVVHSGSFLAVYAILGKYGYNVFFATLVHVNAFSKHFIPFLCTYGPINFSSIISRFN